MPLYKHSSFDKKGSLISGSCDAPSLQSAKESLRTKGYIPVKIEEAIDEKPSILASLFQRKVPESEKMLFSRQLGILLAAGIPLLKSIELLTGQFTGPFNRILLQIRDDLKEGTAFSETLKQFPRIFPPFYVQMIATGELSGNLEQIVKRLSEYQEKAEISRKKVDAALRYPLFLLAFTGIVMVGILTSVVPGIASMFTAMNTQLPGPTAFLIALSDLFINYWAVALVLSVGGIIGTSSWYKTEQGRLVIDHALLKFPLTRRIAQTKAVSQFAKTLGILLESGIGLAQGLAVAVNIVENQALKVALATAQDNIIKEGKVAKFLKETHLFPEIATHMISTGEESGHLDKMLIMVGNDYESEYEELVDRLVASLNPAMMLLLGGMVLLVALAIILPTVSMTTALQM